MTKVGKYVIDLSKISVISPKNDVVPSHNSNGQGPAIRHFWIVCDGHRIDFADTNYYLVDEAFDKVMMSKGFA